MLALAQLLRAPSVPAALARHEASLARQLLSLRAAGGPARALTSAAPLRPALLAAPASGRRFATGRAAPVSFPRGGGGGGGEQHQQQRGEGAGPEGFLLYWRDRPRWWIPLVWLFMAGAVGGFGSLAYTIYYLLPSLAAEAQDKFEENRLALERGILTESQRRAYSAVMLILAAGLVYLCVRHNRHQVERIVFVPRTNRVYITTPRLSGAAVVEDVPVSDLSLTLAAKRLLQMELDAAAAGAPAPSAAGYIHFNVKGDWFPFFVSNKGNTDDRAALAELLDGVPPRGLAPHEGPDAPAPGFAGPPLRAPGQGPAPPRPRVQ